MPTLLLMCERGNVCELRLLVAQLTRLALTALFLNAVEYNLAQPNVSRFANANHANVSRSALANI